MAQSAITFPSGQRLPLRRLLLVMACAGLLSTAGIALAALLAGGTAAMWTAASVALLTAAASTAWLLTWGLSRIRSAFASEQLKIQTLLNAVPEGILEVNASGIIVFANKQACELFGYELQELLKQPVEVLVPRRSRNGHAERRSAFFQESRLRAMGSGLDISGVRKDGSEIAVDISLSKLATPQGPVMYCLIRDNQARKAFESQLLDSNRRLLSGVATLERNAYELRKLTEMGDLLHSSTTESELFRIVAHTVDGLFPRLSGALYTLADSRSSAQVVSSWGTAAPALRALISRDDCWALRRSRPHSNALVTDEPRCSHYLDGAKRPCQCIPLLGHGDLLGVLHLCADDFNDSEELAAPARVQFIHALANQVALSTANLRLRESLQTQSLLDPLTGLYNRRVIDEWFEREIRNAAGAHRALSLLILDIDHFKSFNDRFGHECGDLVLRELANLLRAALRTEDLVARLGGEEFAVLLPDTAIAEAELVAEKLRRAVEALRLERSGRCFGPVTVSIGVAALGADGASASRLLRHADRALYRAKHAGRNRVLVCSDADHTELVPLLSAQPRRA